MLQRSHDVVHCKYPKISARMRLLIIYTKAFICSNSLLTPRFTLKLEVSRKNHLVNMAEAPSSRYVTRSTISEAMINTVTTALRSSGIVCPGGSGNIEMDLLLCDYVKLRKVRRGEKIKKTRIDKKLQVGEQGYCVCWWTGKRNMIKIVKSCSCMDELGPQQGKIVYEIFLNLMITCN